MADLSTAADRFTALASTVTRAWEGLCEAWQDSDAEQFGQTHLAETIVTLSHLAEELGRVDGVSREAEQELA